MELEPTPAQQGQQLSVSGLPRAFGPYLLFDRIGRGGMAEIFLARCHGALGSVRRVVIKEVLPELSRDDAFARLLVREAKLAAGLRHRNIVQVLDLGRENERLFIAMEYVEGYDLNQLLRQLSRRRLPLPMQFALLVVREVLQALDYAHRALDPQGSPLGMVHRDISPANVLISFEGEVSLCDFGIARALDLDTRRPERVRVAGKSAYMAPEHARGDSVDARSDLFAAGIVLWELCAGRRLYRGSDGEMLEQARLGAVPPLPDRGFPARETLQALLERALAVDPAARFQSAGEMLAALEDYALATGLMASQLRFGAFLSDHFADEIVALRRARERAAEEALSARDVPVADAEPVTVPSDRPKLAPSAPVAVAPAAPTSSSAPLPRRRASDAPAAQVPAPLAPRREQASAGALVARAAVVAVLAAVAAWLLRGARSGQDAAHPAAHASTAEAVGAVALVRAFHAAQVVHAARVVRVSVEGVAVVVVAAGLRAVAARVALQAAAAVVVVLARSVLLAGRRSAAIVVRTAVGVGRAAVLVRGAGRTARACGRRRAARARRRRRAAGARRHHASGAAAATAAGAAARCARGATCAAGSGSATTVVVTTTAYPRHHSQAQRKPTHRRPSRQHKF